MRHVVAACLLLPAGVAHAQPTGEADRLFDEARAQMTRGAYAEACPLLEASERLDPAPGTEFHLADCYEHTGRLASAWGIFVRLAEEVGANGETLRARVATARAQALAPKLGTLRVTVVAPAPGLVIERRSADQPPVVVAPETWGRAAPVDAGSVTVRATSPSGEQWETTATAVDGAALEVVVPAMMGANGGAGRADASSPGAQVESEPHAPPAGASGSWHSPLAIGCAALAAAGVATGIGFGLASKASHDAYEPHCTGGRCDAVGSGLQHDAVRQGTIANVAFATGAAAAIGAAVLWWTAPEVKGRTVGTRAAFGVGIGEVRIRGEW